MNAELTLPSDTGWDAWLTCLDLAFGGVPLAPEFRAKVAARTRPERSVGRWDGAECVGTAGAYAFRVTGPVGAEVPAAG
ncbi:GNAT family N-acetyltransferase, partial [Burkholderia sp. Ax-1735]